MPERRHIFLVTVDLPECVPNDTRLVKDSIEEALTEAGTDILSDFRVETHINWDEDERSW